MQVNKEYLKEIENLIKTLEDDKVGLTFQMIEKLEDSEYYLKGFRDYHNTLEYAHRQAKEERKIEGKEEGRKERDFEFVTSSLKKGFDNQTISELTGLSIEEIEKLKKE